MSETTTSVSRPKSNALQKPIGPLPMWGWMAIIAGLALVYSFYKKSKASATSTQSAQAAGQAAGGVDSSLVPQFVNQVYNQETPPPAPNVTVNNQVPVPDTGDTEPSPNPSPKPNKPPSVHQYQAPQGLKVAKATATSLKVTWNNLTNAAVPPASYTVAIYSKAGKLLHQSTVSPDAKNNMSTTTITGLPSNAQGLQVHVWANGGQLAPPHASQNANI
jgi:hypothetical protein